MKCKYNSSDFFIFGNCVVRISEAFISNKKRPCYDVRCIKHNHYFEKSNDCTLHKNASYCYSEIDLDKYMKYVGKDAEKLRILYG